MPLGIARKVTNRRPSLYPVNADPRKNCLSPRLRGGLLGFLAAAACFGACAEAQVVAEKIAPDTVRFYASPASQASAKPSVAIEGNWPALGGMPIGFPVVPIFSDPGGGNARVTVPVPAGSNVYGTGLVAGPLERTGRFTTLYNEDSYQWGDSDQQLYQSHPWVLVVRPDGSSFGVIFDSTWRSTIDLTAPVASGIRFQQTSAAGYPPVIVIERSNPADVVKALSDLTGRPFMPPLWSIGFHQSRYSYTPAARSLEVAQGFRDRRIPADTIWFDIDYMSGAKNFTFNAFAFPNPAATNASLRALGFSSVWIIDPGTKQDSTYSIFTSGFAGNHFVKQANQTTDQTGTVWPGTCVWPDFTRAETRQWWAGLFPSFLSRGADGVWNDMNEPSVFNVPGGTMPNDAWHRADAELGGPGTHLQYHNIYGMQMVRATRDGFLQTRPALRPFVLSRANYLGGQKYAATWTGDNTADWYHLDVSISNVLNLGLSGQPNSGPDIGGYSGTSAGDGILYLRWLGLGSMLPFSRVHTEKGGVDREPWVLGASGEEVARLALQRRYQLLPHLYTLFHEAHTTGMPVARPLFFAEPANPALRTRDDEFLLGDGLVVACATSQSGTPQRPPLTGPLHRFSFPVSNLPGAAGDEAPLDLPHLYLRGGSIVPVGPIRQNTREGTLDPLTLIVALDENGLAGGMLYEDAGDGFGYQQGDYRLSKYSAFREQNRVHVTLDTVWGSRPPIERRCVVRLLTGDLTEIRAEGRDGDEIVIPLDSPPATLDPRHIDGRTLNGAFEKVDLLAFQTTPSAGQNNTNELNAMWVRPEIGGVRIGLSGNLGTDASAVAIFLDTQAGGQNQINTGALASPPPGLAAITNTRLESGFNADRLLWVSLTGVTVSSYWVELNTGSASTIKLLGRRLVNSGFGLLSGGINPAGIQVAIDNTNTAGVEADAGGDPLSANTGVEIFIPDAALGPGASPCRPVQIMAALVGPDGTFRSQVLPPAPGSGSLGMTPDFGLIPGAQVALGYATLVSADVNLDGSVNVEDLYAWEQGQGVRDIDRSGVVDANDREWLMSVIRCREAELETVGRR